MGPQDVAKVATIHDFDPNFPLRNVVSSGIAMGTVVVEASGRSGARMQARLALEHGKRLFLVEPLVLQEEWAERYAERPATTVVRSVEDVIAVLDAEAQAGADIALLREFAPAIPERELEPLGETLRSSLYGLALLWLERPDLQRDTLVATMMRVVRGILLTAR